MGKWTCLLGHAMQPQPVFGTLTFYIPDLFVHTPQLSSHKNAIKSQLWPQYKIRSYSLLPVYKCSYLMCNSIQSMIEWTLGLQLSLLSCCSLWFYGPNFIINLSFNFSPPTLQQESPGYGGREWSSCLITASHLSQQTRKKSPCQSQSNPPAPP